MSTHADYFTFEISVEKKRLWGKPGMTCMKYFNPYKIILFL
jgi:hypothetical protein